MREFAGDVFTARNIEFQFHSPGLEQDLKIGTDARRQIFLIFKEAVNNIARHSCCTQAEIEFRVEKGWALLRVSDNGKGLDSKRTTNGNGLINMRLRAEKMGGDLQVASNNGNGTTLVLKAPLAFSLKQKERFAR